MMARPYTEVERRKRLAELSDKATLRSLVGRELVIDKRTDGSGLFEVDMRNLSGAPYVGSGRTMHEALGSWLHNNQSTLGLLIDITEAVVPAENNRRSREIGKR